MKLFFNKPKPIPPAEAPWMDPGELSQLLAALFPIQPKRMLEWGSGGSTLHWMTVLPSLTEVLSVEHNGAWFERVKRQLVDPRVNLVHVPPSPAAPEPRYPATTPLEERIYEDWCNRCEVDAELMKEYVGFPRDQGPFDFVFVDGRARNFCIELGLTLLSPGGILALHDAQRPEYHAAVRRAPRHQFLVPFTQGQVCLISR